MKSGEPINDADLVWGFNSCRAVIHRALAAQRSRTTREQFETVLKHLLVDLKQKLAEPMNGIDPTEVANPSASGRRS